MSDPVLVTKEDLAKADAALKQSMETSARLERDLKLMRGERDQAMASANQSRIAMERAQKLAPSDKVAVEVKALRSAVAEAHKKISALEKDLAASQAATDVKHRELGQAQRRFEAVQSTFESMQLARDKAQKDRDQAIASFQKEQEAHQKLKEEFAAFRVEVDGKAKAAKPQKAPEPAKA